MGEYSSKVQQPGPLEMPRSCSNWSSPPLDGCGSGQRVPERGVMLRAAEQQECLPLRTVPLASWAVGSVQELRVPG